MLECESLWVRGDAFGVSFLTAIGQVVPSRAPVEGNGEAERLDPSRGTVDGTFFTIGIFVEFFL